MSRVLQSYGEKPNLICAGCANAMWMTTTETTHDDFPEVSGDKRKYCVWCALRHVHVLTEIDDCDGYLPEGNEEPKL